MKKGILLAVPALIISAGMMVAQPAAAEKFNAWRHCGIGAAVFPDNGTASAISNIIWDLGTTALTSATVSKETCNSELVVTARFIDENYAKLEAELAIGEGQHVDTMFNMFGVSAEQKAELLPKLRAAMIIDEQLTRSEKAEHVFVTVQDLLAS